MWNLAVYFPLMIGNLVPDDDEEWKCFFVIIGYPPDMCFMDYISGFSGISQGFN